MDVNQLFATEPIDLNPDEDDKNDSIPPYPCMPSLVALQQMRNRLHLAYVGKKLMKWTAQATARELRKLAWEITLDYSSFKVDMQAAYMLLARARYFCPNVHERILENLGDDAPLTVSVSTKSVSGVKVLKVDVHDSNMDAYAYLGLSGGGQAITQAKRVWRGLLKRILMMLEHRVGFEAVDVAHKSATKRKCVLGKVAIPRIQATIRYIVLELEEINRENLHRMKMVLSIKRRQLKIKKPKEQPTCPICLRTKSKREKSRKRCYGCGVYLYLDGISHTLLDRQNEEEVRLQEIKMHLSQIADITKAIDMRCAEPSFEKFIQCAEDFRKKLDGKKPVDEKQLQLIPSYISDDDLCSLCRQRRRIEKEEKDSHEATDGEYIKGDVKESVIAVSSELTTEPLCEEHAKLEDLELGIFEYEVEEITKIVRVRNEDGTVHEQKKVIRVKKERRAPLPSNYNIPDLKPCGFIPARDVQSSEKLDEFTESHERVGSENPSEQDNTKELGNLLSCASTNTIRACRSCPESGPIMAECKKPTQIKPSIKKDVTKQASQRRQESKRSLHIPKNQGSMRSQDDLQMSLENEEIQENWEKLGTQNENTANHDSSGLMESKEYNENDNLDENTVDQPNQQNKENVERPRRSQDPDDQNKHDNQNNKDPKTIGIVTVEVFKPFKRIKKTGSDVGPFIEQMYDPILRSYISSASLKIKSTNCSVNNDNGKSTNKKIAKINCKVKSSSEFEEMLMLHEFRSNIVGETSSKKSCLDDIIVTDSEIDLLNDLDKYNKITTFSKSENDIKIPGRNVELKQALLWL